MSDHTSTADVRNIIHVVRILRLASYPALLRVLMALAPAVIDTSRIREVLYVLDPELIAHRLAFLHKGASPGGEISGYTRRTASPRQVRASRMRARA